MASAISIPPRKKKETGVSSSPPSEASSPASSSASASPTPQSTSPLHRRRPQLLSSSVSKVEHSVFDLGMRDGSPRLITCVKASQGFDWNLDIFLPSSCDITVQSLHDKIEPVHEIHITEEEYKRMLPS